MPTKKPNLARILTISLGGLWLLDGILQLQPAMFTSAFVQQVLAPTLQGQPSAIAAIINFGITVWNLNPFAFNVVAAGIQLLIGVMLILTFRRGDGRTKRFALWLSVAWALIIWIFGEGFGMIATGNATFYTGAPGSALLYAILALFLLDEMNEQRAANSDTFNKDGAAKNTKQPLAKLPIVAGIIFLVGAALQLAPMFWQPTMLSMLATVPAVSNWLGAGSLGGAQGTMLGNLLAIDILAALGIFLICLPRSRTVAWLACAFLIAVWWIGQNFGGTLTFPGGTATDPNSAVVLVLFLVGGMMS
jgi:hypothetical protein